MGQVNEEQGRRRGLGLWRLLPFAGLVLGVYGNVRYALGGADPWEDAQLFVVFAMLVSVFYNVYGPPIQGPRRDDPVEKSRRDRAALAALATVVLFVTLAAMFFSVSDWSATWAPRTASDWRIITFDLIGTGIYVQIFHGMWTGRRGA